MAITFVKKAKPTAGGETGQAEKTEAPKQTAQTTGQAAGTVAKAPVLAFMKTGSAAKKALDEAEAKAEAAKEEIGKLWRFFLSPGEEKTIAFMDGEIGEDGMLTAPVFDEHEVWRNGSADHFVCVAESEPCPICAEGEHRSALIGLLTVIELTPYKVKTGKNAGKIIQYSRKLYTPKRHTIAQLTKIALKRGGLTGCVFEVSRGGEKDAKVGSQFDFVEKLSMAELAQKYDLKIEDCAPADYSKEITYRNAEQLVELGLGKAFGGPGTEKKKVDTSKLKDEL